jgi:hypothetical protein
MLNVLVTQNTKYLSGGLMKDLDSIIFIGLCLGQMSPKRVIDIMKEKTCDIFIREQIISKNKTLCNITVIEGTPIAELIEGEKEKAGWNLLQTVQIMVKGRILQNLLVYAINEPENSVFEKIHAILQDKEVRIKYRI